MEPHQNELNQQKYLRFAYPPFALLTPQQAVGYTANLSLRDRHFLDSNLDSSRSKLRGMDPSWNQNPKVLIGIVTHDGDMYCLPELVTSLQICTYKSKDILVVDNSNGDGYKAHLEKVGLHVIKDSAEGTRIERIIRGRNRLREEFLQRNVEYLFFLDSDVIMRPDYLSRLVAHRKDITCGLYLANFMIGDKQQILPVVFERIDNQHVRHMLRHEVQGDFLLPVGCAGLGCTLISRRVMEKISFRNIGTSTTGGEDAAFYKDALMDGFVPYCDTSIKCLHMKYPRNDAHNKIFAW